MKMLYKNLFRVTNYSDNNSLSLGNLETGIFPIFKEALV